MSAVDMRRPAEVTADFRSQLAELLQPHGFAARAKGARFVRKRARNVHEISLGSSHYNAPGGVTCFVTYWFFDAACKAAYPDWRGGGSFEGPAFFEREGNNIARADEAAALLRRMVERLAFFELLERPGELLPKVCERYVPGFYEPHVIVPYLRVHLGAEAVRTYVRALLTGRPELWPAFLGAAHAPEQPGRLPDHGTSLARALLAEEALAASEAPLDAVLSKGGSAGNLRSHFGLLLRAWGEPAAAGLLRRSSDEAVERLQTQRDTLPDRTVDSVDAARLALELTTGEARDPARLRPEPRHFQCHVAHGPFRASR
jgi:hypothetical protein